MTTFDGNISTHVGDEVATVMSVLQRLGGSQPVMKRLSVQRILRSCL